MTTPPGWHPDPSGRHQHRFWDGSGWTDQVSDDGTTATDPIDAPATGSIGVVGEQAGSDPWAGSGTATGPGSTKSKAPMFIGIAVVVALVAGGAFFLTSRDGGSGGSSGAGDHTLTVGTDEVTAHTFEVAAGDFVFIRYDRADEVTGALGLPESALSDLVEIDSVLADEEQARQESAQLAAQLFGDLAGDLPAESSDEVGRLRGYDGLVVNPLGHDEFEGSSDHAALILISPVSTDLAVVLAADDTETEVLLQIRTETPSELPEELNDETVAELYASDEMQDFRERMAEEFGLSMGPDFGTDDFTDDFTDFTDDFTDDWTDWSDDFTDDFTDWTDDWTDWSDWTDDFTDDWTDWSDDWSDIESQFTDLMSDWDGELSDW